MVQQIFTLNCSPKYSAITLSNNWLHGPMANLSAFPPGRTSLWTLQGHPPGACIVPGNHGHLTPQKDATNRGTGKMNGFPTSNLDEETPSLAVCQLGVPFNIIQLSDDDYWRSTPQTVDKPWQLLVRVWHELPGECLGTQNEEPQVSMDELKWRSTQKIIQFLHPNSFVVFTSPGNTSDSGERALSNAAKLLNEDLYAVSLCSTPDIFAGFWSILSMFHLYSFISIFLQQRVSIRSFFLYKDCLM